MTREKLKEHCQRAIDSYEYFRDIHPVTPDDIERYSEHKMVLDMIEKIDKIEQIIENTEYLCRPLLDIMEVLKNNE